MAYTKTSLNGTTVAFESADNSFLSFYFNGKNSLNDFGIYRVSDGNDGYEENLNLEGQEQSAYHSGILGQMFALQGRKAKAINISVAFENLSEQQLSDVKTWLNAKEEKVLWFSETPYKVYKARVSGVPNFSLMPFAVGGKRIYKGTGKISFICSNPFAYAPENMSNISDASNYNDFKNFLDKYTYGTAPAPFVAKLRDFGHKLTLVYPDHTDIQYSDTILWRASPTSDGYRFVRWDTQEDGGGIGYYYGDTVSQPLTLYPIFEQVYLTLLSEEGLETLDWSEDGTYVLPDRVGEDQYFTGWSDSETDLVPHYYPGSYFYLRSSDRTLHGIYEDRKPLKYSVTPVTKNTYNDETTYENETFVVVTVYPKSGGTVTLKYGGLTKTIIGDGENIIPNGQDCFFGTLYGQTDQGIVLESGELEVMGDYYSIEDGTYKYNKSGTSSSSKACCITGIEDWGNTHTFGNDAFIDCPIEGSIELPSFTYKINGGLARTLISYVALWDEHEVPLILTPSAGFIGSPGLFNQCNKLKTIELKRNVPFHGGHILGCTNLIEILDSNNNNLLENGAYYRVDKGQKRLEAYLNPPTDLTLPDGVHEISQSVFDTYFYPEQDQIALKNIVLPASLKKIGLSAFQSCSSLDFVTLLSPEPPEISSNSFNSTSCKFIVPKGYGNVYKQHEEWAEFVNRIYEEGEI